MHTENLSFKYELEKKNSIPMMTESSAIVDGISVWRCGSSCLN